MGARQNRQQARPVARGREGAAVLQLHQQMVDNGGVCTVETKRTVERIYRAYSGLGGNGVGTEMRNDILDARIQEDRH